MKTVKVEQSKSYRELLLRNLQNSIHAAGYLEAVLEEKDEDFVFLSQLLKSSVSDFMEAQDHLNPAIQDIPTIGFVMPILKAFIILFSF